MALVLRLRALRQEQPAGLHVSALVAAMAASSPGRASAVSAPLGTRWGDAGRLNGRPTVAEQHVVSRACRGGSPSPITYRTRIMAILSSSPSRHRRAMRTGDRDDAVADQRLAHERMRQDRRVTKANVPRACVDPNG